MASINHSFVCCFPRLLDSSGSDGFLEISKGYREILKAFSTTICGFVGSDIAGTGTGVLLKLKIGSSSSSSSDVLFCSNSGTHFPNVI